MNLNKRVLFVFLLFFVSISLYSQKSLIQLIKENENSVFLIKTYDKFGNPLAQGTGFFIDSNGTAISNVHVFENSAKAEIKTLNNKTLSVSKILSYNEDLDILKFRVTKTASDNFRPIRVSKGIISKGEDVFVISNPVGLESSVSNGIVSCVREFEGYGTTIQISAPISHGSSGAPVFNMKGDVIGIATFGIAKGQNLNFAVDIKSIFQLKDAGLTSIQNVTKLNTSTDFLNALNFYNVGNFEKALGYFLSLLPTQANNDTLNFRIGVCYSRMGKGAIAYEYFDKTLRINPKFANAYFNRGVIKDDNGDLTGALNDYSQTISLKPQFAGAYCNRGIIKSKLGDKYGALADFDLAISTDPNDDTAYYSRGLVKEDVDNKYGALSDFDQAIIINPQFAEAYNNRANIKTSIGDKTGALNDYNQAIILNPTNSLAYSNRAGIKKYMGDVYGALNDYNQAVNFNPQFAGAYNNRGMLEEEMGNINEAFNDYRRAINIDENYASPYNNLAVLLWKNGDKNKACEFWNRAANLGLEIAKNNLKFCR
jgi:tetratricopeptide (TPR) repeat protein